VHPFLVRSFRAHHVFIFDKSVKGIPALLAINVEGDVLGIKFWFKVQVKVVIIRSLYATIKANPVPF